MIITTTLHTYPELVTSGDRLAATDWGNIRTGSVTVAEAVAATLSRDDESIILRVVRGDETVRGFAPGGIA